MTTRKRCLSLFLLLIAVLLTGCSTDYEKPNEKGKIVLDDSAELFTSDEEKKISDALDKLSEYGNAAVITINKNKYTTALYAAEQYNSMFGTESGFLFVIDMDNREIYIETDGYIGSAVSRANARTITDNCYRYASDGKYGDCTLEAIRQAYDLVEGRRIPETMAHMSNAVLAILAGLLINFIVLRRLNRKPDVSTNELTSANRGRAMFRSVDDTMTSIERTKRPGVVILKILMYILMSMGESSGHGHSGGGRSGGGRSGGGRSGGSHGSHGGGHRF